MGLGFPRRFTRDALGPTLRNTYPVENPETDIGAEETFNPVFHQITGMNLVVPRAALVAEWGGASFTLWHQEEAWNPKRSQAHPVLARTGAGLYTYTFAATYLDENGVAIPTALVAARAWAVGYDELGNRCNAWAVINGANPLQVDIRLENTSAVLKDPRFWLEVL